MLHAYNLVYAFLTYLYLKNYGPLSDVLQERILLTTGKVYEYLKFLHTGTRLVHTLREQHIHTQPVHVA